MNDLIGINYELYAHNDFINEGLNCNGLVYQASSTYKKFIDGLDRVKNIGMGKERLLVNSLSALYEKIDFEDREKDCIIYFRRKGLRAWSHVGIMINRNQILHTTEDTGSIIESVKLFEFSNNEFLVFKEKEV